MGMEKVSGEQRKGYWETRNGRRRQKRLSPIQILYDTCREVFANYGPGIVPSPENIDKIKVVLDGITQVDVGVKPNMTFFKAQKTNGYPAITYIRIHECDKFSIGIFCLPPSGVIPLHNHPEMTVFSKLLFGTMHIKSFDWVKTAPSETALDVNPLNENGGVISARPRLAKVKVDSEFTAPCNTSILYPTDGGNMHCFTAITPCAVLDVLGPPYSDPEGRHCAYFIEYPFTHFPADGISVPEEEREGHAWLQETEEPEGLTIYGKSYSGPKIVTI